MRPRHHGLAAPLTTALLTAALLLAIAPTAFAAPPAMSRDDIICRASSGVGFSYHWGGGCWCASGCNASASCSKGSCSGNCPSCSHSGTYGADCSGFVTKVWQVPSAIDVTSCGHGSYVAASYTSSASNWSVISRSNLKRGDAMASSSHVLIYEQGDPWGSLVAYEARGCSYGIVHNTRTCSSSYSAARRVNLTAPCECSPGDSETAACGNCGTRTRTCESSCNWGAWSACSGEGECSPGTVDSQSCCDCGTHARTCNDACSWDEWSACDGPDPQGEDMSCDSGEPGPCASGTTRCVHGCLTCVWDYQPTEELCDNLDNDCSGAADDGDPTEMGTPLPAYAARLVDSSFPTHLEVGEVADVSATFLNEGGSGWPAGKVRLVPAAAAEQHKCPLYDADGWPAWNLAAELDANVAPGEQVTFEWTVRAPLRNDDVVAHFELQDPQGEAMRCPAPEVRMSVRIGTGKPAGGVAAGPPGLHGVLDCSFGHGRSDSRWAFALMALALALAWRRRAGAR